MKVTLTILKKYWGYHSFKACQEEIINSCIEGKDTVALLPTGGGKSVCFQIPAIIKEGICLVISPLIALIEDQVAQLKNRGIKAIALTSSVKTKDLTQFFDNCRFGSFKFIYLSPERLQNEVVLQHIQQLKLNLIAVDEAHCISEWGHDFRPDYRKIKVLREIAPGVPIIALTATATTMVVEDIQRNLELCHAEIFKTSFFRSNLAYKVFKVENKLKALLRVLTKYPGSSIIYVRNRKACNELTSWLGENRIKSTYYHGGIDASQKSERLQQWMSGLIPVMVATNAFGMGIDKPNVRNVIHLALPDSIENYFQETGRAGRDQKDANAFLFYNQNDIRVVKNQFVKTLPEQSWIKKIYKNLINFFQIPYGEGELQMHQFNFNSFCQRYDLPSNVTYNCMQFLDQSGIINFTKRARRSSVIHIRCSGNEILSYVQKNEDYKLVIKTILRFYGGVFEEPTAINIAIIAKKIEKAENFVINVLHQIAATNMLSFTHAITDAEITWLVPREDHHTLSPLLPNLKKYRETKINKVAALLKYIENNSICRSKQLVGYFDQKLDEICNICDVCLSIQTTKSHISISVEIEKLLTESNYTFEELTEKVSVPEIEVITVLRHLLEKGIIKKNREQQYYVSHE